VTVALRYALLAVGAVLVLGVSIYLLFELRAPPAQARGPERTVAAAPGGQAAALRRAEGAEGAERAQRAERAEIAAEGGVKPQAARATPARTPPRGPDGEPADPAPHKLDELMNAANGAYDRGELDDAKAIARRVLATSPNNVRMLRIIVSASCINGDTAEAQSAYVQLPPRDREQMRTRCARVSVSFTEP